MIGSFLLPSLSLSSSLSLPPHLLSSSLSLSLSPTISLSPSLSLSLSLSLPPSPSLSLSHLLPLSLSLSHLLPLSLSPTCALSHSAFSYPNPHPLSPITRLHNPPEYPTFQDHTAEDNNDGETKSSRITLNGQDKRLGKFSLITSPSSFGPSSIDIIKINTYYSQTSK